MLNLIRANFFNVLWKNLVKRHKSVFTFDNSICWKMHLSFTLQGQLIRIILSLHMVVQHSFIPYGPLIYVILSLNLLISFFHSTCVINLHHSFTPHWSFASFFHSTLVICIILSLYIGHLHHFSFHIGHLHHSFAPHRSFASFFHST